MSIDSWQTRVSMKLQKYVSHTKLPHQPIQTSSRSSECESSNSILRVRSYSSVSAYCLLYLFNVTHHLGCRRVPLLFPSRWWSAVQLVLASTQHSKRCENVAAGDLWVSVTMCNTVPCNVDACSDIEQSKVDVKCHWNPVSYTHLTLPTILRV